MYYIFVLIFACLPACLFGVLKPSWFKIILTDIRIGRILHYFIVYCLGISIAFAFESMEQLWTSSLLWTSLLFFIALTYAAVFAIITNNIEDLEIDRISNQNRPLVKHVISQTAYMKIGIAAQIMALIVAGLTSSVHFIGITGLSLLYYLYSCKPFKLKRFVFLAKGIIGANTLIAVLSGFLTLHPHFADFPQFWLYFLLVPISLMANFVDLKDYEGDKAAGIKTLPVLIGKTRFLWVLSVFAVEMYLSVGWYFDSLFIRVVIGFTALLHLFLLHKKPYLEKPLFILHNSLFIGLIVLVLIDQHIQY
ncbi:MAG: UbiA family prenyltransferase [Fluviicola sp.]|nr:UbiA family prenyltransferase [Fluviicola sp.]